MTTKIQVKLFGQNPHESLIHLLDATKRKQRKRGILAKKNGPSPISLPSTAKRLFQEWRHYRPATGYMNGLENSS